VRYISLLLLVHFEFTVLFASNTSIFHVDTSSESVASNSEQNCVEFISLHFFISALLPGDLDSSIFRLFKLGGSRVPYKFSAHSAHVVSNSASHVLIKAPEENTSYHNLSIVTKCGQETSALECHVRSANNKSLAGCILKGEQIVTSNTEFFVSRNAWVGWTTASCNNDIFCGDLLNLTFAIVELNSVSIYKCCVHV